MKIQEMKSGILHLNRKMENERRENVFEIRPSSDSGAEVTLPVAPDSELDEPRWSVISFDRREAGSLTYIEAATLMFELDAHGMTGLCIVTDDVAARMRP